MWAHSFTFFVQSAILFILEHAQSQLSCMVILYPFNMQIAEIEQPVYIATRMDVMSKVTAPSASALRTFARGCVLGLSNPDAPIATDLRINMCKRLRLQYSPPSRRGRQKQKRAPWP
jgi:hypothetical protein